MTNIASDLGAVLDRWNHFGECLLHRLELTDFGYTLEVVFNVVWDDQGRIRSGILEQPRLVTLSLHGVARIDFEGGPYPMVIAEPCDADWSLSEIALVRTRDAVRPDLRGLEVRWEGGQRRIEVDFKDAGVREP